jgi:hypothetical protein
LVSVTLTSFVCINEGAIKNGFSRDIGNIGNKKQIEDHKQNTTQKTNKMGNTDLTKTPGGTHVFVKGNQLL